MNSEPITKSSSTRICNHMNKDHQDAVNAYAKYYGKIETFKSATMISLSSESIELKVDDFPKTSTDINGRRDCEGNINIFIIIVIPQTASTALFLETKIM